MLPAPALPSANLKSDLIASIPQLRAFAISLCRNADRADDLVQETMVKAWRHLASLTEGSNLRAWLFTILRNVYFSEFRKRGREVSDTDGVFAGKVAIGPRQTAHMDMLDFRTALAHLSAGQREALILVGAAGHSYDEAATICGCAAGTIKSRVNRARRRLAQLLSFQPGPGVTEIDGDEECIAARPGSQLLIDRRRSHPVSPATPNENCHRITL